MKIYTKGGDKGRTGIRGGTRVDKDDIRIETNGTLDELNCVIGTVRAFLGHEHGWQPLLYRIQRELMVIMSQVATPAAMRADNSNQIDPMLVTFLEEEIDRLTADMGESEFFILPGGDVVSAHLHLARTFARRSERRLCSLHKTEELPPDIIPLINRLSDLFFAMARYEIWKTGETEEQWKRFLYKKES